MFLETDGSVAWLYFCPKVLSPVHTMNQCRDKNPILYRGQIQFFDPNTRQTCPHAMAQNCCDRIKNLFQFDMDQEDSWYTLKPCIVHQDKPAIFGPQDVKPIASHFFTESQDAGMYASNEPKEFWDSILINAALRTLLSKSYRLHYYTTAQERTDGSHYYTRRTEFFVDKVIHPDNLKINFRTHSDLSSPYLSTAEYISPSFCASSLSLSGSYDCAFQGKRLDNWFYSRVC